MKMKIALAATSLLAAGSLVACRYLVSAVGRGIDNGYTLGWTEGTRGMPLTYVDFYDRLTGIMKAKRRADSIHKQWHADNPGKSCSEIGDLGAVFDQYDKGL